MKQVDVVLTQPPLPFNFIDYEVWSLVAGILLVVTSLMMGILWFGWRAALTRPPLSPFGDLPLRPAVELPYESIGKIYVFLTGLHQYDNRMFNIHRASVCRTTGRIFPASIDLFGRIKVDWTHLQRRYRGSYVSWGSLNEAQQADIRRAHQSMEGFQTLISCPDPSPRAITDEYFLEKPGPLYVNLDTKVLLGWKIVPGTDLEVLVVQKPRKFY